MRRHTNILISGKVQNVAFRWHTKHKADDLGITGYVMNTPDGNVWLEVEGESETLEVFLKWCSHGPESAEVRSVKAEEAALKNFNDFHIKF